MRDFNTAGPVRPRLHYCVPPLDRLNIAELLHLIRAERYFVLHAPRQTGKTTALLALRDLLNDGAAGRYRCAYLNVEPAQTAREDVGRGMGAIASEIAREARNTLNDPATAEAADRLDTTRRPDAALGMLLETWARAADSPLVVLIDEIDALVGDTLVSALRQLRAGYAHRPAGFPQSVVLCGVRDVRDYRIHASSEREVIAGGSAFNIKTRSLRLGDFTRAEVETLLGQHAEETGQEFSPGALDAVWEQTRGQPWLVNALAQETCFSAGALRPHDRPISERDVFEAREALILRRETHLDQLADKLREPRVRRVIEPLLSGGDEAYSDRDFEYVRDLGLVAPDPPLRVANPIYAEVLPRELTWMLQHRMPEPQPAWYVDADGGLDMDGLLAAFQDFFRQNSEHWVQRAQYTEAGPQLVLQAFLHRVVNGRGRIEREYALGSRRVDLLVVWPGGQGRAGRFVVECKLLKDGRSQARTVERGLEQTAAYMDLSDADAGHLVVFDMREGRTWAEKIYREEREQDGTPITVWGT
ncbi:ATP-binding protein [Candidatus Palauibacter sp.]|uniref:ATP-binding protein n=1 Tax=Candidatus Palauibacter sp. TaxID=3101350 RepID=UPI003B52CD57